MFSFCMYCCKERCVAITISLFSILYIMTSSAAVYFMKSTRDGSYVWDLQDDPQNGSDVHTIKLTVFWGVISLCGLAMLTGILGVVTAIKFKNCCTISLYSFLTLFLTLAFLLIGGLLMTVTVAANRELDEYCQASASNNSTSNSGTNSTDNYDTFTLNFARYFLDYADNYESATSFMVSSYMCTNDCPCEPILNQTTLYPNGFQAPLSQLNFNGTYTNFSQCY